MENQADQHDSIIGLPPPKLRNLRLGTSDEGLANQCIANKVWEIGVPTKNSLYWSIIFSFLYDPRIKSDDEFQRRLVILCGGETEIQELRAKKNITRGKIERKFIKSRLTAFNPFKNRHVSFFDEDLNALLRVFRLRLNRFGNGLKQKNTIWNEDFKLEAASQMLKCGIDVYLKSEHGLTIQRYPKQRDSLNSTNASICLVLFQYENIMHKKRKEPMSIFRFSMNLQVATRLQTSALSFILQKAKIPESLIKGVLTEVDTSSNFLVTMLNSEMNYIIPALYRSPYIALKLSEAGFDSNPRTRDCKGRSPFLHAMMHADTKLLRILYDYAANFHQFSEICIRNPNECVIESAEDLGKILKEDRSKIDSLDIQDNIKERILQTSGQFSRFNEYQVQIAKDISRLRQPQGVSYMEEEDDFKSRKDIIKSILTSYQDFFWHNGSELDCPPNSFESFVKNNEYYVNLDSFTCLLIFDNLFKLIEKLEVENIDFYCDVVSAFFLLTIASTFFPKYKYRIQYENRQLNENDCENFRNDLLLVPFVLRLSLQRVVSDFIDCLEKCNILKTLPKKEIDNTIRRDLHDHPIIKDELLTSRVRKYIKAAIEVSPVSNDMKGIAVIERALQIIGESIKPPSTERCIVSFLLCSCLSSDLRNKLIATRNKILSHYEPKYVQGKLSIEQDMSFFKNVQDELKIMDSSFQVVYYTQHARVEEYMITLAKEYSQDSKLVKRINDAYETDQRLRSNTRREKQLQYKKEFRNLSFNVLDYLEEYIKNTGSLGRMKVSEIRKRYWALDFLLRFISRQYDSTDVSDLLKELEEMLTSNEDNIITEEIKAEVIRILNKFRKPIEDIFQDTEGNLEMPIKCPKIEDLFSQIQRFAYISEQEKEEIRNAIENVSVEARKLQEHSMKSPNKDEKGYTKNQKSSKSCSSFAENSRKSGNTPPKISKESVDENLSNNRLAKEEYWFIVKDTALPEDLKGKLFDLVNQKVHLLLTRIGLLKNILIDDDEEIKQMWSYGKSQGIKAHTKFLMSQRYQKEFEVRSAIEMVLFDCSNILKRNSFTKVWEKATFLYAGVCLRDVLSHGYIILENVGRLLDPTDLPNEIINKVLELIENSDRIKAMLDLCKKLKIENVSQLEKTLESETDDYILKLQKVITKNTEGKQNCIRWKKYLKLLPINHDK